MRTHHHIGVGQDSGGIRSDTMVQDLDGTAAVTVARINRRPSLLHDRHHRPMRHPNLKSHHELARHIYESNLVLLNGALSYVMVVGLRPINASNRATDEK